VFVSIVSKQKVGNVAYTAALLGVAVLLLWRPQAVATGISRGLSICTGVIIPTLYPFMLLSGLLSDSPLCRRPGRVTNWLTRRLFGLPGCCGPAILLSLVGGYPAGTLAIGRLRQQGLVTDAQVKRMCAFCVNAGPGFIISTVGAGLLGSVRAGLLLCIAHVTVPVCIGIALGRGHRRQAIAATAINQSPRPIAVMVADTCSALLTMCGFVVLAATVLSLAEALRLSLWLNSLTGVAASYWSAGFATLLEVSSGCVALVGKKAAPFWLCLALGWGGLSVQGQLAAAIKGPALLTPSFWGWRLLHGVASGLLATLLFALIPTAIHTGSQIQTALPYSVSTTASVMLLVLSFLAMLCFSPKKTGKTE